MCSAAPHQHTHAPGRTVALEISILAVRDISLASISSKESDDSLSRLVARIGCRVSLPTTVGRLVGRGPAPQHARTAYGIGRPAPPRVTNSDPRGLFDVR